MTMQIPLDVLEALLSRELAVNVWPFFRIAGVVMVAPVFGARLVPMRTRLAFAVAATYVMSPLVPVTPPFETVAARGPHRGARGADRCRDGLLPADDLRRADHGGPNDRDEHGSRSRDDDRPAARRVGARDQPVLLDLGHADLPLARRPSRDDPARLRQLHAAAGRRAARARGPLDDRELGRPDARGRGADRAAGRDRAARREHRVRRDEPRGADA